MVCVVFYTFLICRWFHPLHCDARREGKPEHTENWAEDPATGHSGGTLWDPREKVSHLFQDLAIQSRVCL